MKTAKHATFSYPLNCYDIWNVSGHLCNFTMLFYYLLRHVNR